MSLGSILCVSGQPARLEELQIQLTETWADYALSLATTELGAIACLNQLIGRGAEVPLVIVDQTLATAAWVQNLYQHFPRALALVLSPDLAAPLETAIPPGQLYRRLALPWAEADLRFTVGEGLRRYRQEQQLAQAQAALAAAQQKSKTRFQQLTESLPGMVYRYLLHADGSDQFTYLSPRCRDLFGVAPESVQACSSTLWEVIHPEDVVALKTLVAAAAQQTDPMFQCEFRVVNPDGAAKWVRVEASQTERLANGDVVWNGFAYDVTQRKGIELEMRRNRDLREAIFNEATDALFLVDLDTDLIVDCNRRAQELFEADDRASLINIQGNTLQRQPFSQAELLAGRQELVQRGFWSVEVEYQTLKGGSFWGNLAANPITVIETPMLLVRVTDVSERKRIEALLRQGEQQLHRTLDFAGIGTWSVHPDIDEVRCNPTMATLLEVPQGVDSFTMPDFWRHWRDRVPPEDMERLEASLHHAIATEEPFTAEYRYRMDDGSLAWRWAKGQAVYTETGTLERLLGVTQDITQRKQAELALGQAQDRYRRATQAARAGVWEMDIATQSGYLDPNIKALVGYGEDEIADSLERWLELIHPDDRAAVNNAIQAFSRSTQGEFVVEYRMLHKDGTVLWVLSRGQLQRDPQGQPELFFGTTTDITSLKQAELALKQLNAELEQRVSDRTQALQALAAVVENSADLIGTATLSGRGLYLNPAGCELLGLGPEGPGRKPLSAYFSAATMAQFEQEAMPTVMAKGLWRGESTFLHQQTGAEILVEQTMFLVRDPDSRIPRCMATICRDIGDRKRAEIALRQTQQNLEIAVEAAQMGTWYVDLTQDVALVRSQRHDQIYGYDTLQPDWSQAIARQHVIAADQAGFDAACSHGLETGHLSFEVRVQWPDGSIHWIALRGRVEFDGDGTPLYSGGVNFDITDRKQAELAIKTSEERFRGIFDQAALGILEVTLEGQVVQVNPAFCALLGYTAAELLTKTFMELTHPDDLALDLAQVKRLRAGAASNFTLEKRYLRADQRPVWVSLTVSLIQGDDGQPRGMMGIVNDISDRKRVEQALQESRNMMQLVLDTIPQRVFWKDRYSRYLGCNLAFARDLSLAPAQIVGKTDFELPFAVHARRYRVEDSQIIAAQTSLLSYEEFAPSKADFWVRTIKVPLTNADGLVIGVLGCYEDISDIKQVEASLRQLNGELEQRVRDRTWELQQAVAISEAANLAKSTFLANMSHELRTPLNAILGFSQLMACDETLSSDSREAITIINRSGEHLLGLINDVLETAKIEAGQVSLKVVCFDLDILINTLSEMFHLRASNKGLTLNIEAHPALPRHLRADEPKLRQVLINLVDNAIKFTHQGQVAVRIAPAHSVTAPLAPNAPLTLIFTVSDTGIGIAPVDCDQLFEPFMQVSQGDDGPGGTGLGLTISRQFVQKLGGEITVESQIAQGTTFTVTVPVRVAADSAPALAPTGQVTGLVPGQPSYRILVVDDDETHRYLLTQLLQSVGFEVRAADNGQTGLDLWQQWRPQLIWLDMRMPVLTGYEVAQYIRAQEPASDQPPTKIIALTANAFEDDRARALDMGCDDFVRKPFQLNHLLVKLAEHLDVQYSYVAEATAPPPLAEVDAIAALRRLPTAQLIALHQATLQLDDDQMTKLIAQIPPDDGPLAALLTRQLEAYAFDALHTLLQQARQG